MLSFGILTTFISSSLILFYIAGNNNAESEDKFHTFTPSLYYEKVERGEGLETTFAPEELAANIQKEAAKLNAGYVQKCVEKYRNTGSRFENRYMTAAFMNSYPEYRAIRREYFQRAFEKNGTFREADRNEETYKAKFDERYGEKLKSSNLGTYWRYFLFVRWLLTTDEWRSLNSSSDVGELAKFHDALHNHTTMDGVQTKSDDVAHSFGNCWTWLRSFSSDGVSKPPVRPAGFDTKLAKQFIRVFDDLEENAQVSNFCSKVFVDVLDKMPNRST